MGACAGKHRRTDNGNNSEQQKRTFGFSTAHKRGKQKETTLLLSFKRRNIDDAIIDKAHLKTKEKICVYKRVKL